MADLNKYTVGWVCALDCELVAARLMLDEEHDPPVTAQRDENNYHLGKIGHHYVVIAGLPDAQYGISSATAVARDMLSTFSNIRTGLMVGIGGGAPTLENDVRLGDVVVGSARNGKSSVFQYTFGKQIQVQEFKTAGLLNEPPNVLRTAVRGLRTTHEMEGTQFEASINAALERLNVPRVKNKYRRPKPDSDILFRSDVIHVDPNAPCTDCCGLKDQSKIVTRSAREDPVESYMHYGRIASADRVMKDAEERDRLAQEGVLCFEMEAAGLMNNFPCLVIRGICDYSDSHKNKEWQGYAALVAAVYAKQLLKKTSPNQIETERRILDIVNSVDHKIDKLSLDVAQSQSEQQRAAVLSWLRPPDPSTNYNKAKKSRPDQRRLKYGTWLLQHKDFQSWKTDSSSCVLWLYGNSGCGKTVLSSTVIEALECDRDSIILCFYFDFADKDKQKLEHLLRSLVSQLGLLRSVCQKLLEDLYSSCSKGHRQPSPDELCGLFTLMIKAVNNVYIVIDALDECTTRVGDDTESVLAWLKSTLGAEQAHVRILVTSRPEEDIRSRINEIHGSIRQVQIQGADVEPDIRSYLDFRLQNDDDLSRWRERQNMQDEIKTSILREADGIDSRREHDLLEALRGLPKTLNDVYQRILQRIPERDWPITVRILQFLLFSPKPLTIKELSDAIAVDTTSEPYLDVTKRCEDPQDIASYCSGFVIIVDQATYYADAEPDDWKFLIVRRMFRDVDHELSPFLQLSHLSVKEFLLSGHFETRPGIKKHFQRQAAEMALADVCVSYLLDIPGGIERDEVKRRYPLADYCSENWYIFAVKPRSVPDRLTDKTMRLLRRDGFHIPRIESHNEHITTPLQKGEVAGLYYASFFGLMYEAETALSKGADVNAQGGYYGNALQAAAYAGYEDIVKVLLSWGAHVNAPGGYYGSALNVASRWGYIGIVKILLAAGADVNVKGGREVTPLQIACRNGYGKIVKILLDHGADVNAQAGYLGRSALHNALEDSSSSKMIVELLLGAGADVHARNDNSESALQLAVMEGRKEVADALWKAGARETAETMAAVRNRKQQKSDEFDLKWGSGKRPRHELQQELKNDLKLLQEIMDDNRLE